MRQRILREFLVLGIAVYILLWVAILNGYPLVFPDTGQYLLESLTLLQSPYRAIMYSIFMRLTIAEMTPWLVILTQSLITVYVLRVLIGYISRKNGEKANSECGPFAFLALTVFLAFGTSLPWFVSQLMPDVFTALAFLAFFLLLYGSDLSIQRTIVLSTLLFVSVGSHLSNFVSLMLVLAAVLFFRFFVGARLLWPKQSIKRGLALVLVPILASAGVAVVSNWRSGFGLKLSGGTPVFLLGRLFENGLAHDYLEQECKIEPLTPCGELDHLPRGTDEFLWSPHPLLTEMGGWTGARDEASRIVWGTIRRYPIRFLLECGKQTARQLVSFGARDSFFPVKNGYTVDMIKRLHPEDLPTYQLTKQWSGRLLSIAGHLFRLYEAVFWASLCGSLGFLVARRSERACQLFLLTIIFLFSNALVTGSLAGVYDRYQTRVSWLVSLCCASYILQAFIQRRAGEV